MRHCSHTLKQACYRDFKDLVVSHAVRDAVSEDAEPPFSGRQMQAFTPAPTAEWALLTLW